MGTTILSILFLAASFIYLLQLKQKHLQLSFRILLSLALGIGLGTLLQFTSVDSLANIKACLQFIGYGYLALLKMLVIPLILTSIIHAIINLGVDNGHNIKKMSFATCFILLTMTAMSSLIALVVGTFFHVGTGMNLPDIAIKPTHTYTDLADTLLNMLPSNPIATMADNNTVGVVILAVLIGLAARRLDHTEHDKLEIFKALIASLFALTKKLANIILELTPYGIIALIALLISDQGISLLSGMLHFTIAMYVAMLLVMCMHCILLSFFGYHPLDYFKKAITPLFVAFTTRSSFGTLPVTEETLKNSFKTHQVVASFVPSLGATIGMNACAGVFPAMLVVMTLTILHQPLTMHLIIMVMLINMIASLGISGIPGTAYIAATISLTSLNLPYSVVALVQGIDPIIDMGRTATNVNAVMTTALLVDKIFDHAASPTLIQTETGHV